MIDKKFIQTVSFCLFVFLCIGCIENDTSSEIELSTNSMESDNVNSIPPAMHTETDSIDKATMIYAYSADDYDIATANNAFAFDMYLNLTKEENLVFSPYSIFTAMAVCYDGAEGATQEEIAYVFNYPLSKPILEKTSKDMMDTINSNDDSYDLKTANALWVRKEYPLNQQFVQNSKKYYEGNVTNIDFRGKPEESRTIINEWVASKTNDKIKYLIPENLITIDTAIIITNAVYFKGKWMNEFDTTNTEKRIFYNSSSSKDGTPVDMMYIQEYFSYGESKNAKIVELPYKGNDLCMYIVLPEENDIGEFEDSFTLSEYTRLKSSMNSQYPVQTWLPKFKIDTKTELPETLQDMGIVDAFGIRANFSEMVPEDYMLWLDDVIHQAFIDVQEKGTEAAAATAIEAVDCAVVPSEKVLEFKADHPFLFIIEDKRTGCILFMGKVEEPEY
ncbi:serpin family protein [Methanolobus profundi]|uniref:Serpin B n=1 Tax=Methanolobus profundi TaxID=487685 RepID=A0A1I4P0U2_9EURY|nr:serpin family protein [Methanolobus profundi]SFM21392.1 serpin B [Methanolobus profundi]